ncbi:MAG: asparagine synthase (glutamine-hydrolyzing) [Candidatus Omnitrophica bacterium]|nr:asparagine synthase (glutamine-hydrolyzing) [Candidatus Omnitrophota bacterium]
MCGIVGRIEKSGRDTDPKILNRMANVLRHRGPDAEGYYRKNGVALEHRRLSIIDLTTGDQPLKNEAGDIILIANGEIYNFKELRKKLEEKGHRFRTKSDNEVIIHLYEEEGVGCLKELRGMFAFGLWDEKKEQLLLVRDRLGKKPLVYAETPASFNFASEIQALLLAPDIKKEINRQAIDDYLTFQYIPSPGSIFSGIKKLPPGHYLTYQKGRVSLERYWEIDFNHKIKVSESEAGRLVLDALQEAVQLRMISDVPLGAFLSGGIDSSAIVGLMSRISEKPVRTFSVGFSENNYDELKYAEKVARLFGTEHSEFMVRPDIITILPEIIRHYNEPFGDNSAIPTYYLCAETKKMVTVALSGDGGDENFAGYPRYRQALMLEKLQPLLSGLPKSLAGIIPQNGSDRQRKIAWVFNEAQNLSAAERYGRWMTVFPFSEKEALYQPSFKNLLTEDPYQKMKDLWPRADNQLDKMLLSDFNLYLPDCLQVKMDIASMSHGLEVRSPFLDQKVVELTASLPAEYKLRSGQSKYLLKKIFKNILPAEILKRKKMGFGIPLTDWFRHELKDYLASVILSEKALKRGYFNSACLKKLFNEHTGGRIDHANRLYLLLVLEIWHQIFID